MLLNLLSWYDFKGQSGRIITIVKENKFLIVLIIISLILGFNTPEAQAQSQGSAQFETADVNLFPEFNQSSVYVAVDLTLIDNTQLPKILTLQVPVEIDDYLVTYLDEGGLFIEPDITLTQDLRWKYLRFSSPSTTIRLEYSDSNLVQQGNKMSYAFKWRSLYPVYYFKIQVYQPEGISQFESDRILEVSTIENSKIKISTLTQSPFPSDTEFNLSFSYITTGDISYPGFKVEAGEEITEASLGRVPQPWNLVLWFSSVALFIFILVGIYLLWFQRKISMQRGRIVQGVGIMNPEKMSVYCHECGMRSSPGDSYCSNCGTELRRPTDFIKSQH